MKPNEQAELAMLKLSVRDNSDPEYLELAAGQIRRLPRVVRVRTDARFGQIEIVFQHPATGLLRQIHSALQAAHCSIVSGKTI